MRNDENKEQPRQQKTGEIIPSPRKQRAQSVLPEGLEFVGLAGELPEGASVIPAEGMDGAPLLALMDGLSTHASYLIVAVRGVRGIICVRRVTEEAEEAQYKVKLYPNVGHWDYTQEQILSMGFHFPRLHHWYHRFIGNTESLKTLLQDVSEKAQGLEREKDVNKRFKAAQIRLAFKSVPKYTEG